MKKFSVYLCIIAAMAAMLCGCTKKEPTPSPTASPLESIMPTESMNPSSNDVVPDKENGVVTDQTPGVTNPPEAKHKVK